MSHLSKKLQQALDSKLMSDSIDLHSHVNDVLKDVKLSINHLGGQLSFYGKDPLIQSGLKFGAMAAIGLACKAVAVTDLWRFRGGESTGFGPFTLRCKGCSWLYGLRITAE